MKIVRASATIIDEPSILKKIEQCGRVCYKSEDKITDDSFEKFISNIIKRGHESVLEHGNLILKLPFLQYQKIMTMLYMLEDATGIKLKLRCTNIKERRIISGNIRMFRDFIRLANQERMIHPFGFLNTIYPELFGDLDCGHETESIEIIQPEQLVGKVEIMTHRVETVKFIVDRGVSHELVRHRENCSYSQESTRYCDYGDGHVTYIIPIWVNDVEPGIYDDYPLASEQTTNDWFCAMWNIEDIYKNLRKAGWTPQEARSVLPNSLKTEVMMTATVGAWYHFMRLRTPQAAHPQMREVTIPLLEEMKYRIPAVFDDITV